MNVYTDGGLVREGVQGESVDGDFSTGRGGAGNIGKSPRLGPQTTEARRSVDLVPEINMREPQDEFHTGVRSNQSSHYKNVANCYSAAELETFTRRNMVVTANLPMVASLG